jgi:hypothetical protein
MKANLRFFSKSNIQGRYVVELSIHELTKSSKYPDGIKYGLICKDLHTNAYVLMDNHHPKGPHVHVNDLEFSYKFISDEQLIEDFKRLVLKELGVKL